MLLHNGRKLWAYVHDAPRGDTKIEIVTPQDLALILRIGKDAIANTLSTYPSVFLTGLRQDGDTRYTDPSPFTLEGYEKTTGVTTDIKDIDPRFHGYWEAVEASGHEAHVRQGTDAVWLMVSNRS